MVVKKSVCLEPETWSALESAAAWAAHGAQPSVSAILRELLACAHAVTAEEPAIREIAAARLLEIFGSRYKPGGRR